MQTRLHITDEQLNTISNDLVNESPEATLRWAIGEFGSDVALATGFGAEGCVLIHMLALIDKGARIFYLDTDLLFSETYKLLEQLEARYEVRFERKWAGLTLGAQASQYGEALWERQPDLCCSLRKVEPLQEVLRGLQAWMTGIRRDQSTSRSTARIVERDRKFDLIKINPLATWSETDVWSYIKKYDVPYNPLYKSGYSSIGCTPCTTVVQIGEHARAGRWRGKVKTECGLHQ
jgi:phosphoadenosine phosphosulfate reductase